jgi:hypothetical protein
MRAAVKRNAVSRFEHKGSNETLGTTVAAYAEICFDRFRLLPAQRLLLEDDSPVNAAWGK